MRRAIEQEEIRCAHQLTLQARCLDTHGGEEETLHTRHEEMGNYFPCTGDEHANEEKDKGPFICFLALC